MSPRETLRRLTRRHDGPETRIMAGLVLVALTVLMLVSLAPNQVPFTSLMVPLILGSLLLTPRQIPWFVGFMLIVLAAALAQQQELTARVLGAAGVQVLSALIVLVAGLRRARLGVGSGRGESMFVELRDRILGQGGIPALPDGWYADSALRSAGGTAFAGDFVVTSAAEGRLEIAVVDVSGKGEQAGTRALLLCGALGGLLGALPPAGFLPAANVYLLRQDWAEGFATAVHLSLDLASGRYELRTAGHPPGALWSAAGEQWELLGTEGPFLGLLAEPDFRCVEGRLGDGDALMLYTDGMVEESGRDIDEGIQGLLVSAGRLLGGGAGHPAQRLVETVGSRDDDRAVLIVGRRDVAAWPRAERP